MVHLDVLDGEGNNAENLVNKAQDVNTMLDVLLALFGELQETGCVWDLHYRIQVSRDIKFVMFVPF